MGAARYKKLNYQRPKICNECIHSTTDQIQNLTPRQFKRGLAPPRASGVSGAARLGRLVDSANPGRKALRPSSRPQTFLQVPPILSPPATERAGAGPESAAPVAAACSVHGTASESGPGKERPGAGLAGALGRSGRGAPSRGALQISGALTFKTGRAIIGIEPSFSSVLG